MPSPSAACSPGEAERFMGAGLTGTRPAMRHGAVAGTEARLLLHCFLPLTDEPEPAGTVAQLRLLPEELDGATEMLVTDGFAQLLGRVVGHGSTSPSSMGVAALFAEDMVGASTAAAAMSIHLSRRRTRAVRCQR